MYSLNVLLCVLRLTTVFFFIYMYYSVFTNTYSVREICTSKTILITTKLAVNVPQGATVYIKH